MLFLEFDQKKRLEQKILGRIVKTEFFVSKGTFWGKKSFFCENDFQFFSFWLEKLQKFRGENRRGSWSSFVRVQRTSWGAFSRNNHLFSFYFGICAKSMEFSSQVFIRVVYRTFYMFFVSSELFLANRYCNICCILILSRFQQSFFWPFLLFFSRVSKASFRLSRGPFLN